MTSHHPADHQQITTEAAPGIHSAIIRAVKPTG